MKQAVVIIGGYNSAWPFYLKMARALEALSGLQAIGVPLMPWHWWDATKTNQAGELLQKLEQTVLWARRRLRADRFVFVGHSAGGLLARLYLQETPVCGRVYAGHEHVSHLITLGSPHCVDKGVQSGWYLTDLANELAPGMPYADHLQYTAVVGRYLLGREAGHRRERRAFEAYRFLAGQGDVWGDGIVPISAAGLDGADPLVLEGVAHSRKYGRNWYGSSKEIVRRWWRPRRADAD